MLNREAPANPITDDREDDVHDKVKEIAVNILIIKWESTGNDSITAELLKADIQFSSEKIYQLMKKIWQYEKIAKSWRRGLIIKLAEKGNTKHCKNWRGITLLSVVGTILFRIIIDKDKK